MIDYASLGKEVGSVVQQKQEAYGDSFGKAGNILRELYPNGINPSQYDDVLAITRVIDKLFRLANQKGAFNEDPWKDIAGYALLSIAKDKKY